jgi:hypothetical protein
MDTDVVYARESIFSRLFLRGDLQLLNFTIAEIPKWNTTYLLSEASNLDHVVQIKCKKSYVLPSLLVGVFAKTF